NGIDLTQTILRQTPVPAPATMKHVVSVGGQQASARGHIVARVSQLLSDDRRLDDFRSLLGVLATDTGDKTRKQLMDEIDAVVASCYGFTSQEYLEVLRAIEGPEDSYEDILKLFEEIEPVTHA